MEDREFLISIIKVAEGLVKRKISESEKSKLIKEFNDSNEVTAHLRAIDTLEKTFNRKLPKKPNQVIIEKAANIDDINNKISAMRAEAEKWEQEVNESDKNND